MNQAIRFWLLLCFLWLPADAVLADSGPSALPAVLKSCGQCHRFSPDAPEETIKGPDLFYAGGKFQKAWLAEFLKKPEIIRQAGYITDPGYLKGEPAVARPHPSLSAAEARSAADYLTSLKLPGLEKSKAADRPPLSVAMRARTKSLFERNYGCSACHETINLAGKVQGGISGPSLIDAGNRLQADWIFHWLQTPRKFQAKGRMPVFALDDETAVQIVQYLMTMKKENLK